MNQFRYVMKDFKNRKVMISFFLLLVIAIFVIFTKSIEHVIMEGNEIKELEKMNELNVFYAVDSTSEVDINRILDDENTVKKEVEFFNALNEKDVKYYIEYDYYIGREGNISDVTEVYASQEFFNFNSFDIYKGRKLEERDFINAENEIPIIVGFNLRNAYKLNKVYSFEDGNSNEFKGKVVGILAKNSNFYRVNDLNVSHNVDNSYFVPIKKELATMDLSVADIDMALSHMVLFTNNIDEVQKIHDELGVFETTFNSASERIEELNKARINRMWLMIVIIGVFILILMICLWIGFNKLIEQRTKEYGIHLLYGASFGDIFKRFIFFVVGIEILAMIVTAIIVGINKVFIFTMILAFVIGLLILMYPYAKLKKMSIVQILK